MKQPHPDTAYFVALILATVQEGAPQLQVICKDKAELNLIRNTVNAAMEELLLSPRLKTLNLIGWKGSEMWFKVFDDVEPKDFDGKSIFVSPELVESGLSPEIEQFLSDKTLQDITALSNYQLN